MMDGTLVDGIPQFATPIPNKRQYSQITNVRADPGAGPNCVRTGTYTAPTIFILLFSLSLALSRLKSQVSTLSLCILRLSLSQFSLYRSDRRQQTTTTRFTLET